MTTKLHRASAPLWSLALRKDARWPASLLLGVTAAMWLSLAVMVPLLVTQTAFFGIPNRTFMVSFAVWLMVAARPIAAGRAVERHVSSSLPGAAP